MNDAPFLAGHSTKETGGSERASKLREMQLQVTSYDPKTLKEYDNLGELENAFKSKAEKLIRPIAEKLGVYKKYKNKDIQIEFEFSKTSMKESTNAQSKRTKNFADFEKMLACMDELVENAKLIEVHDDRYKGTLREDRTLKNMYVLLSAYKDGTSIVPVQFAVKEKTDENRLYLAVTMTKIKEAGVMAAPSDLTESNEANQLLKLNVAHLLQFVNSSEGEFFKYIPDELLNAEQSKSKQIAKG